ncbi:MAG: undecaprenyl-diphosphate phosphatase [Wenzhouxiangellaceae bacterium]
MTGLQLLVLALVQGISEFLPVSSSAHLALLGQLVEGWHDQGLAFDAAVHVGTLLAVCLYFRADLVTLLAGSVGPRPDPAQRRLLIALGLASVPVLAAGALLADWIEQVLRNPLLIGVTTVVFGALLGLADVLGRQRRAFDAIGWRDALVIGLAQVLALVPGTSRSGITITAARALGLGREAAARFSFLLSIPVILAAGGWGFVRGLAEGGGFEVGQFFAGAVLSGLTAWLTIAVFMGWIRHHGLMPFVIYRLLLGGVLIWWFWP